MNELLQSAIENGKVLGKLALYFGCWDRAGHYLHKPNGSTLWKGNGLPSDLPWNEAIMDGILLNNGKVKDDPDGRVWWTCGGKDAFWYAFYWWDRSVDQRGACNSGFYVRGFSWPEAGEAFAHACSVFPNIVQRQVFPLVLQERKELP